MNVYFKALLLGVAVAGLSVPMSARADFRDYNYKAWAQQSRKSSSRSAMRSRPMYRNTAPVIVRTEPVPNAVAQGPTERRSYSYEPSQQGAANVGCGSTVTSEPAPATAQRSTETRRSFSYEPSMETYSAPRMRSSQSSRTPKYLLQKTDPNKYRN